MTPTAQKAALLEERSEALYDRYCRGETAARICADQPFSERALTKCFREKWGKDWFLGRDIVRLSIDAAYDEVTRSYRELPEMG